MSWLAGFGWQWPALFILLPAPWLLRWALPAARPGGQAIRIPVYEQLSAGRAEDRGATYSTLIAVAMGLLWLLLVMAAARPVWYGAPEPVPTKGRDLMLAIDISDSMRVDDIVFRGQALTRIDAVKAIVAQFVQKRHADRIGLILFGHQSFVQSPLTFDHDTITVQLNEAMAGFAGSATAIGDVLGLAIRTLRSRQADSRVLILLTDGANTAGSDPLRAASIAAQANIRIHTIGIGAAGRMVGNPAGDLRWQDASAELDVAVLRQVAQLTGGQFFRAHDADEMAAVYQAIDRLEPSPEPQTFRPERSLLHWPLAGALLIAGLLALRRPGLHTDASVAQDLV